MKSFFLAPLGLLLLLMLAGCGGGGSDGAPLSSSGGQGRATLTIQWPIRPTRLVPLASNSIGIVIKQGAAIVAQQTLARPAAGGTSTVSFATLPTGTLSATATAYPNSDGTGVAQASATIPLVIQANQTTNFSITMDSTITHIDLSALQTLVKVGATLPITATAKDASGAVVLLTPAKLTWQSSAIGIATVDLTGIVTGVAPGSADITVTDSETGKAAKTTVLVNVSGPVSFQAPTLYSVTGPNEIVTADFDGDGKIDCVVGTSSGLVILYGKGDGTFETPQTILTWTGGISPYSVADMNGDGKPDLVCTASSQVLVIHNLGGRKFAAPIALPCGAGLGPLTTADFNGDGRTDIAVTVYNHAGSTSTDIFTFQNQGGGVYVQGPTITNIWIIQGLKTADLNGDGKADLLVSITTDVVGQSGTSIYFGDGTGKFNGGGGAGTASFNVNQTVIADFNGDGKLDYAIANDVDGGLSVILNTGGGTFGTPANYGGLFYPDHLAAADIDGDGHPDIVVENRDATYFTVMRNQNGLFPNQVRIPTGVPSGPLAVADLNGDGKPDVIVSASSGDNHIAVILNNAP